LSSVSHDLRTPLTTILGSLREIKASSPQQEAQLAATRAEAERLHRFVANLLDMVRIEAGALHQKIEPVDLSEAVASALDDLGPALQGHPTKIDIAPDLPLVMVDPQLFHHCLINLIENATKYGAPTGPVTMRAVHVRTQLSLCIEDEGPGIPEGQERRIFETFTRIEGSDRKGGTGLGLAIVKGFAEAMGLELTASNRDDGKGASFRIAFQGAQLKELPSE
jgi:two-component system, OmpR family, sensor histidine kinase KdpD